MEQQEEQDMLGYMEFKEILRWEVQKVVEEEVCFRTEKKNNQHEKEMLTVRMEGTNIIPAIHLQDLYEEFQNGKSMEACVEFVKEVLEMKKPIKLEGIWGTWEEKKAYVRIRMVNREWNREQLKRLPHRVFCNLAMTFRMEYQSSDGMLTGYDIEYQMLEHWGITEEEVAETALANLRKAEYTIRDLEEVIFEILGKPKPEETDGMQFVLTNNDKFYGAAGILRTDLLRQFAEEQGCDFYILPSSLHELILVPDKHDFTKTELRDMVETVNEEQVAVEERLSDDVYYFSRYTGEVEVVSD